MEDSDNSEEEMQGLIKDAEKEMSRSDFHFEYAKTDLKRSFFVTQESILKTRQVITKENSVASNTEKIALTNLRGIVSDGQTHMLSKTKLDVESAVRNIELLFGSFDAKIIRDQSFNNFIADQLDRARELRPAVEGDSSISDSNIGLEEPDDKEKMLAIDRWINIESLISPAIQADKQNKRTAEEFSRRMTLTARPSSS